LFYCRDQKKAIPSSVIHEYKDLGDIVQSRITRDGRLIINLEKNAKTVKIWHHDIDLNSTKPHDGYSTEQFALYCLPEHKHEIMYFKYMSHDLYETASKNLPNILLTITKKNEIFLYYENLMNVTYST